MKKVLALLSVFISSIFVSQVPPRPEPARLYNNLSKEYPQFLNSGEAAQMEEKLEQFSNQTSNQICIVIVDDLGGTDASGYAFEVGNKWGVGKKGFNNGIVILVKPTGGSGGRDLFIATGYGLEGAIPDLMTARIRDEMYPYLKQGQNYQALDVGTDWLMKLAKGEINQQDYVRENRGGRQRTPFGLIFAIIVIIIIIRGFFRGGGGGRTFSRTGSALFWGSMLGNAFGNNSRGWGGGGSSSGGFGGFGGGGFGGGGSGGKW